MGLGLQKREGIKDKRLQICYPNPTAVLKLNKVMITSVSCGAVHTAVITSHAQLYTFGCGAGGRLGLGGNQDALVPQLVSTLRKERVIKVHCSNWHTLCIVSASVKSQGKSGWVHVFGTGLNGQLGLGKQQAACFPSTFGHCAASYDI